MKIYVHGLALLFLWQSDAKVHHHSHHAHSHFHLRLLESRNDRPELNITNNIIEEVDKNLAELSTHETHSSNHTSHSGLQEGRGKCAFPQDAGLVAITPASKNAGWAMSPDQSCSPGRYCPYACPSGQVMAQWNPEATSYTYPQSMDGGLYCDTDGQIKKPFPEKPYCVAGTGGVGAQNKIGKGVSFCQTVLPGNEAMLIPTHVKDSADLAVPGNSYWCNTAAHYYINPPGVGVEEACVWGDGSKPVGNWSPFVAGANTDNVGRTFVKIGWNPIYTGSSLASTPPKFGVRIVCEKGDCNGAPCAIDPASNGVGGVISSNQAVGAGGASFCVVTVPKGSKAMIEVFNTDGSSPQPEKSSNAASSTSSSDEKSKDTPNVHEANPESSSTSEPGKEHEHTATNDSDKPPVETPSISSENSALSPVGGPKEKAELPSDQLSEKPQQSSMASSVSHGSDEAHSKSSTEPPLSISTTLFGPSLVESLESSATSPMSSSDDTSLNPNDASAGHSNKLHHQTSKDPSESLAQPMKSADTPSDTEHNAAHSNAQYTESEGSVAWKPIRSGSIFGFIILFIAANYLL